jgi:ribonuclease HI
VRQAHFLTDSPTVTVYTDGGCDPNPGVGGWGALLLFSGRDVELCGNNPQTTNNQMELEAAVAALAYLDGRFDRCQVELHTDSRYLRQGITQWIDDWYARGWKTKNGQPVKNQDLWRRLYELTHANHQVRWHWVKGHAGDPHNEHVDRLATQARLRLAGSQDEGRPSPRKTSARAKLSIGVSCQGSKGPGGWAVVTASEEQRRILQGREEQTTSNNLALKAATEGLRALGAPCAVAVYATSDYLCKGASQWVSSWRQNNWRTRSGDPVQNRAEWEALLQAAEPHQVTWQLVKRKNLTDDMVEAKRLAAQERHHR